MASPDAGEIMLTRLGSRTPTARRYLHSVVGELQVQHSAVSRAFSEYLSQTDFARQSVVDLSTALSRSVMRKVGDVPYSVSYEQGLFALQSYYAACADSILKTLANRIHVEQPESTGNGSWWYTTLSSHPLIRESQQPIRLAIQDVMDGMVFEHCDDLLQHLYHDLIPKAVRHQLGEYYTPRWMVEHVLDVLGADGGPDKRLLDPTCGSGIFLIATIQRMRRRLLGGSVPLDATVRRSVRELILSNIVGMDRNPLAVIAARANYLVAISDLLTPNESIEVPVYECDSLLQPPPIGQFDLIAGNPPWIAWDHLPREYREATKSLWEHYGLFSLSGNAARHGGGKKDLSALMFYAAADRWLPSGGRLALVMTQTLLQSKGAGDGFRRFQIGQHGTPLAVQRVDDMVRIKPFEGAANWTSVVVVEKGHTTEFPVDYYVWNSIDADSPGSDTANIEKLSAAPMEPDRPSSPWNIRWSDCSDRLRSISAPAAYQARLGANTGGANGVYWLDVLERTGSLVRVKNASRMGKSLLPEIECDMEPDLLYPLLRWSDVRRFATSPSLHLLLVQDPQTRQGLPEELLNEKYPQTKAYLARFETFLRGRAAYKRFQSHAPFYSMYNVGPYSVSPYKVIWRRMDRRLNAAVVSQTDSPLLGRRAVIPQETCVLITTGSLNEAHYLCAILNSSLANFLVMSHSVLGGKGFGTPSILDYLPIQSFQAEHRLHQQLWLLSATAHRLAADGKPWAHVVDDIDDVVGELWDLGPADVQSARRAVEKP